MVIESYFVSAFLGFLTGLLILLFVYGRRIERFINMRGQKRIPYYIRKGGYKKTVLSWVALAIIVLSIIGMIKVYSVSNSGIYGSRSDTSNQVVKAKHGPGASMSRKGRD